MLTAGGEGGILYFYMGRCFFLHLYFFICSLLVLPSIFFLFLFGDNSKLLTRVDVLLNKNSATTKDPDETAGVKTVHSFILVISNDVIAAHTPIDTQSSYLQVFRLQSVNFYSLLHKSIF